MPSLKKVRFTLVIWSNYREYYPVIQGVCNRLPSKGKGRGSENLPIIERWYSFFSDCLLDCVCSNLDCQIDPVWRLAPPPFFFRRGEVPKEKHQLYIHFVVRIFPLGEVDKLPIQEQFLRGNVQKAKCASQTNNSGWEFTPKCWWKVRRGREVSTKMPF